MVLKVNKKEIWNVSLKGAEGHEQKGYRPIIVIAVSNSVQLATILPLTSKLHAQRLPNTYLLKKSKKK
ncbi:MAG: type II toxin-antitoxin system PemK/MazF family toxin [Candidatus Helarchaeota archaeon]